MNAPECENAREELKKGVLDLLNGLQSALLYVENESRKLLVKAEAEVTSRRRDLHFFSELEESRKHKRDT